MMERIFIITDSTDDGEIDVYVADCPSWVVDDKDALYFLDGTPILAVKEYKVMNDGVRHSRKFEDVLKECRHDRISWIKSNAKKLRPFKLKIDRINKEIHFTCLPNQRYVIQNALNYLCDHVDTLRTINKLLKKCQGGE